MVGRQFLEILLPGILKSREPNKQVIVVGDNLVSYFAPSVDVAPEEHEIYMASFPRNATHLMQPGCGRFFEIMENNSWHLVIKVFPRLLNYRIKFGHVGQNFVSGFLAPCNPNEVLKHLANTDANEAATGRRLDSSFFELLQEQEESGSLH